MHLVRQWVIALAAAGGFIASQVAFGAGDERVDASRKVVLVELYTSQGCDMCPSAEALIGSLPDLGYGPDRVLPISFHVDYFNNPWKDPLSNPLYSQREYEYSTIYDREHSLKNPNVLYLTPLVMIDGRAPMLGTDDAARKHKAKVKAKELLDQAVTERPSASIALKLNGSAGESRRKLQVSVSPIGSALAGRPMLVGVALFEDRVSTAVPSGENAGKTYLAHNAVRKLVIEHLRLEKGRAKTLSVPVEVEKEWNADRCGLAVFLQDEKTGRVYQAASIPWVTVAATTTKAAKRSVDSSTKRPTVR